ncbi:MAG: ATP-binding cassette domain-containing protein [Alphaproteobacteria bacterium]|nr:ATP-binding cassette domain-containing protein [Alphaproteobacteria bacterium]
MPGLFSNCAPSAWNRGYHSRVEVDCIASPGEIVSLVGDNGAGNSTLVKITVGTSPSVRGHALRRARSAYPGPQNDRNAGMEVVCEGSRSAIISQGQPTSFSARELPARLRLARWFAKPERVSRCRFYRHDPVI